jgi:hypothetical protein
MVNCIPHRNIGLLVRYQAFLDGKVELYNGKLHSFFGRLFPSLEKLHSRLEYWLEGTE